MCGKVPGFKKIPHGLSIFIIILDNAPNAGAAVTDAAGDNMIYVLYGKLRLDYTFFLNKKRLTRRIQVLPRPLSYPIR